MSDRHESTRSRQDEHEHVTALIRAVDVQAPERLHERVREMVAARERPSRGPIGVRLKPTLAAMAAAAAVGAAIALLSGGGTRSLSFHEASSLTLRAATMAAPRETSAHSAQLNVAVDGVAFPYWEERFGWRSTGARMDTIGGRRITTVFYGGADGSRIGYAIVGGTPAPGVRGGAVIWRGGVPYRLRRENGAPVVVWQRDGRLCVLSGRGVSGATLLRLASWGDGSRPV
ncbi:MAG TPA: hypothetical protein VES65_03910 [Solirubrobacteraceae bacterium]|nr:hypothetical protein [Solirubrobacteraceae bacterium]